MRRVFVYSKHACVALTSLVLYAYGNQGAQAQGALRSAAVSAQAELPKRLKPELLVGLSAAITGTHYTARVQLLSYAEKPLAAVDHAKGVNEPLAEEGNRPLVDTSREAEVEPAEMFIEYQAKVLETLRGEKHPFITFFQVIEEGEGPIAIDRPFIITLCKDSSGYYWPGTGSVFPASRAVLSFARQFAEDAPLDQQVIGSYCY